MAVCYYPAIIERGKGVFGVFFPDLPGCVSAGKTQDEAARNAEEALAMHLEALIKDGEALPEPTKLDAIATDDDVDVAAKLVVRAETPRTGERVNIVMDMSLLNRVDRSAAERGMSRSGLLSDAARLWLSRAHRSAAWKSPAATAIAGKKLSRSSISGKAALVAKRRRGAKKVR